MYNGPRFGFRMPDGHPILLEERGRRGLMESLLADQERVSFVPGYAVKDVSVAYLNALWALV